MREICTFGSVGAPRSDPGGYPTKPIAADLALSGRPVYARGVIDRARAASWVERGCMWLAVLVPFLIALSRTANTPQ